MKYLLVTLLVFTFTLSSAQDEDSDFKLIDYETKIYLETNVDFAGSPDDSRSDAQAGTGTLGLKFSRKFIYGAIRFTVVSKNEEIEQKCRMMKNYSEQIF